MSTIQKRDSENHMPVNSIAGAPPELTKSKSSELKAAPEKQNAVGRTTNFLSAWGAGRFNSEDTDAVYSALAEFFTEDCIADVSSAAHSGVAAYKVHHGFAGLRDWFDFLGGFDFEGIGMSHVEGPTPNEIWMKFSSTNAVCKATGKSVPSLCFTVLTWEGDKCSKLQLIPYNPASVAAVCSKEDAPIPAFVKLPAFEPHPKPLEQFGEKMALWGAGEFSKPEVRSEHIVADCVDDLTDSVLPDLFKAYVGPDGIGESIDHQVTMWELSNIDAVPIVGLAPGCVMARVTFDVKHKTTGKEAKGVQQYNEFAYSADGKIVSGRHYFVNAPLLASIY